MKYTKYHILFWAMHAHALAFSQNVGIGTTSPVDKLTVQTLTGSAGITHTDGNIRLSTFLGGSTNGGWLGTVTNHPLSFFTNNSTARMTIGTNGNIGIGNNNPAYLLDISNRIRLRSQGTDGVSAGIWFNDYLNSAEAGFMGEVGPGAPNHIGMFGSISGWSLVMNTITGNVGAGTFNTQSGNGKLNVSSTGNAIKLSGNGQYISFYDAANNYKGYLWNASNNMELGTDVANTLGEVTLKTRGVEGLAIMSDGRVRMGPLSCGLPLPGLGAPKLSIFGAIGFRKTWGDQAGEWAIGYANQPLPDGTEFLDFYRNGNLAARIRSDGAWIEISDARYKEKFELYKPVLEDIKKLAICTFQFRNDKHGAKSFGLVAQNVQQYFPEIVTSGGPGDMLGVEYAKTGVLAIKAIQEQQQVIEQQQRQIEQLEKRLRELETTINRRNCW